MDKKGLYIKSNGNSLTKTTLENQELSLLAAFAGVEVMIQDINKGITFDVYPASDETILMEFFYVLEGELEYLPKEGEHIILKQGDYFYTKNLQEICLFRTITNLKMLYVSTEPVFNFLDESLQELSKMKNEVEQKDKYTQGHSERVKDLAIKVALEMGLERQQVSTLALAALFHDVGKINIPDEVLKKPSKLTTEENNVIQTHVNEGVSLVKNIKYTDIAKIVEQHHERIDGSGYPKGLTDKQICIEAKIIAVCDSYDAMTTKRPYKNPMSSAEAINEIVNYASKYYDVNVVNAFVKVLEKESL